MSAYEVLFNNGEPFSYTVEATDRKLAVEAAIRLIEKDAPMVQAEKGSAVLVREVGSAPGDPSAWTVMDPLDRAIRKCGGMRGDVFVHRDAVPLDEADLETQDEKDGQLGLFGNDCSGMCGV